MVNFFEAQERARRNTKWLVLFFILAVLCINLALYLVAFVIFGGHEGRQINVEPGFAAGLWQPDIFFATLLGTSSVIAIGSFWKSWQLARGGGAAVAESLGAVQVLRATEDLAERRLLNVVEELAIAAGTAVPRVYVLPNESSINAFAAGMNPSDAVVAVTRGALDNLNREELQGVIGHEFSHIFNGDMRLNLKLMGIIHGILLIALIGRVLMRASGGRSSGSSKKNGAAQIVFLGLTLFIIGYIGVFFGNLIKAAVSRQREYLADASSVQYNRNPLGLSSALQKIKNQSASRLQHPEAETASHMYFGQGVSNWFGLLATHPPVNKRILRLQPELRAALEAEEQAAKAQDKNQKMAEMTAAAMGFAGVEVNPEVLRQSIGTVNNAQLVYAHRALEAMGEPLRELLNIPYLARRLVYALLVQEAAHPEAELRKALQGEDREEDIQASLELIPKLQQQGRALWLPLLDLALSALRELRAAQAQALLTEAEALVMADGKVNFFEFALLSLLEQQLGPKGKVRLRRYEPKAVREDSAYLLSFMARAGQQDSDAARVAFEAATKSLKMEGDWHFYETKDLGFNRFKACLGRLNSLQHRFKARLIEALLVAIGADGKVELLEVELLRAIGARLECPVPPLVAGQSLTTSA
jgi:Zn-dependent protease with chaperone function